MGTTSILKIGCRIVYKKEVYIVYDIDRAGYIYCEGPAGIVVLHPDEDYHWYEDWVVQNINYLVEREVCRDKNGKKNEM
jgi:hypothetical protein